MSSEFVFVFFGFSAVFGFSTNFASKCEHLSENALFFNGSCFAATNQKFTTSDSEWSSLAEKHCLHFPDAIRRLAFVWSSEQVVGLIEDRVIRRNESYLIGSRRIAEGQCGKEDCCGNPQEFHYVDNFGNSGILNSELWLSDEPNNGNFGFGSENLIALEYAERFGGPENVIGFNDVDGSVPAFLLCEYRENWKCPKGSTATTDRRCIFLITQMGTPKQMKERCKEMGTAEKGGVLPSIHNDAENRYFSGLARRLITELKWGNDSKGFGQYWPVLFGLEFRKGRWMNADNSAADYFRWWSLESGAARHRLFAKPPTKHPNAFLMVRTNGDDGLPTYGYWGNVYGAEDVIPFGLCAVPVME